jgi:hypothetical protein
MTKWNIFDRIRGALFGQGKIRCEITTHEGDEGVVKIPYVGCLATTSEDELREYVRNEMLVEHGLHLKTFKIIGATQN